ncbi:MAG: FRG domain-containing protein [Phycisphaerales bacterium]
MTASDPSQSVNRQSPDSFEDLAKLLVYGSDTKLLNFDFVWRGEPRTDRKSIPKIDRDFREDRGLERRLAAELLAVRRFRQLAAMHLSSIEHRMLSEDMQAQVVLRHYGAPTRLLDWSESPWVALFFACRSSEDREGRVLALNRASLEGVVRERFSAESKWHAVFPGEAAPRLMQKAYVENAGAWVVCYHRHGEQFPRLVAQQGLFTVASKPWLDHWTTAQDLLGRDGCIEIVISPALKEKCLWHLRAMGITAASLFPGPDGAAEFVSTDLKLDLLRQ